MRKEFHSSFLCPFDSFERSFGSRRKPLTKPQEKITNRCLFFRVENTKDRAINKVLCKRICIYYTAQDKIIDILSWIGSLFIPLFVNCITLILYHTYGS